MYRLLRSRLWPLLVLASLLASLSGCRARQTPVEQGIDQQILRRGIGVELGHLDPHLGTEIGHYNVLSALYEGLVAEDPVDLHPVPGVASSWTLDETQTRYTFLLRQEARWSNGDRVSAQDFVRSYRRLLSPALSAPNAEFLYPLRGARDYHQGRSTDFRTVGVEAVDDGTLVLTLEHPFPGFLHRLNHLAYFPLHTASIERSGGLTDRRNDWAQPGQLVGNGPFVLSEVHRGQEIVVRKSPTYWDAAQVSLQGIHFVVTPDRDAEERSYRAGQLHLTEALPVAKVETWRRERPEELRIDPYLGTEFYRLNLRLPFLQDVRVRQALNLAVDRETLVKKVLRGGQSPAEVFTPPGLAGYSVPNPLASAPARARQLLAEAGFPGGQGAPVLEVLYNTSESHRAVAEALQGFWSKELGLRVKLVNQERVATLAARRAGDFQALRSVWIADFADPLSFLELWRSDSANNFTGWADPVYDELLAAALREPVEERRRALLAQAEARLLAEPPFVLLYHYTHVYLKHPAVKGWYPTLLDRHPYKAVKLER